MSLARAPQPARLPTGVPGLDRITGGGLFAGSAYLLAGLPGTGKTVLSNQVAYGLAARGGSTVYMTFLGESHDRMLGHLAGFGFFDPAAVGRSISYVSGYGRLEEAGLEGMLRLLRELIATQRPALLVIDGLPSIEAAAGSPTAFRRFLSELHTVLGLSRTLALLTSHPRAGAATAENTVVDGVIELRTPELALRSVRLLRVVKLRGSSYLEGQHFFRIRDGGLEVYPRLDVASETPGDPPYDAGERRRFDVPRLDEMLGGGVVAGSTTMLLGAPGAGKTLAGITFLGAGARGGEPGLYFGVHESPKRLVAKGAGIGLDLGPHVASGALTIEWRPPVEQLLDDIGGQIIEATERRGLRRVLIDGLDGLRAAVPYAHRLPQFLSVLTNELRARGVTTLIAAETRDLLAPRVEGPVESVSAIVDYVLLLRYVELRSRLYRLVSVVKSREGAHDPAIRELRIGPAGLEVGGTFGAAEGLLGGFARPSSSGEEAERP
ncbi:MAG TPA: ATPase domain-containing protein [Planctomycetota bacterium]|nr:ATPase domain-containing protein [Planctomycetota bacterium]